MDTRKIEIELMKKDITEHCSDDYMDCNKCHIEDTCDKYQAPISNGCNDWAEDDIREAHGILEAARECEW